MAVLRKRFFYHEKGNHDERWHYLARDTESGKVYIINGFAPMGSEYHETVSEISEFLSGMGNTAQSNLLTLIGTLVTEDDKD